jgi:regulator of protease activity HflC (stomatin/prohibitin superfamily)
LELPAVVLVVVLVILTLSVKVVGQTEEMVVFRLRSRRERTSEILRTELDEVTERWGVKVTTIEIREITPLSTDP